MIRTRNTRLYIATEATPGTPVAVNDLLEISADATQPTVEFDKPLREAATNDYAVPEAPVIAGSNATIEIMVPLYVAQEARASDSDDTSPAHADVLLKACGLTYDGSVGGTAIYQTGEPAPCSILWNQSGRHTFLTGCVGTCKVDVEGSNNLTLVFSMTGRAQSVAQNSTAINVESVETAYRRVRPIGARLAVTRLDGDGGDVNVIDVNTSLLSMSVDQANEVVRVSDVLAADGRSLPQITAAKPQMTIRMLAPAASGGDQDAFWALLQTEILVKLELVLTSPDDGANVTFKIAACSITGGENEDADGLQVQSFTAMGVLAPTDTAPFEAKFVTPAP